jgi:hypothetical protein
MKGNREIESTGIFLGILVSFSALLGGVTQIVEDWVDRFPKTEIVKNNADL